MLQAEPRDAAIVRPEDVIASPLSFHRAFGNMAERPLSLISTC